MTAQFVVASFGNVKTSKGEFFEGIIYPLDSSITTTTEFTGFIALGYLQVFASSGAAQTFLNTYVSIAARILNGESAITRPFDNTPAETLAINNAQAAVVAAQAALVAAQNALVGPLAVQVWMNALATANSGVAQITASNVLANTAVTTANVAVTTATTALATAQATLATANTQIVSVPYVKPPTQVPTH